MPGSDQATPLSEQRIANAASGLRPAITMQPTLRGEPGEPLAIVIAEVICPESEENSLFAGLGAFVRGEMPADKTPSDLALEMLLDKLCRKGRKLGADAILSTHFKLMRGTHSAAGKLLKLTATGTAVALPSAREQSL
jgi:uncharacterized protein YbjQ (UPF0145 family)